MRISQKLDYASRAMVHLARRHDGQNVVRSEDIAETEGIPPSFLAQILHELKRFGFVASRRGKTGGWHLAQDPSEITLLKIMEVLEPEALQQRLDETGQSGAVVSKAWEEVRQATRKVLEKRSLESLATDTGPMFYI